MAKQRRIFKVAERLQAVLASALLRLSDPRLTLVTITSVMVSRDLKHAKIYWIATGGTGRNEEVAAGLDAANGALRSAVAKELGVRSIPKLRFFYDDTFDVQDQVNALLARVGSEEDQPDEE